MPAKRLMIVFGLILTAALFYYTLQRFIFDGRGAETIGQVTRLRHWFADPTSHPEWSISVGERCGDALMIMPTTGYIGFGWDDSFRPGHRHSGLDIFGPDDTNNVTQIVAAYDGYLTREANWKSTVIIRHPDFPLADVGIAPAGHSESARQIWTYYTHMASRDGTESYIDEAIPPGSYEVFVEAGTLLGRQGNWSGNPARPTGRHLHFSIVKSTQDGRYLDERAIGNTYEPTQFLGLQRTAQGIWRCLENE